MLCKACHGQMRRRSKHLLKKREGRRGERVGHDVAGKINDPSLFLASTDPPGLCLTCCWHLADGGSKKGLMGKPFNECFALDSPCRSSSSIQFAWQQSAVPAQRKRQHVQHQRASAGEGLNTLLHQPCKPLLRSLCGNIQTYVLSTCCRLCSSHLHRW